jgi:hypothetical protein
MGATLSGRPSAAGSRYVFSAAVTVELQKLLDAKSPDESKYQHILSNSPWVFGLLYCVVERHRPLDDENIPDFMGVRVTDGCRDIIEIKPPTMPVCRSDGEFSADFNAAWNQAERYLVFAREQRNYLRDKGLRFENPKCFLICGYDLPDDHQQRVRIREKMNPAIHLLTFNDLKTFMISTIRFISRFRESSDSNCGNKTTEEGKYPDI